MKLAIEILSKIFQGEDVLLPGLPENPAEIIELPCYRALQK